MKKGVGVCLIMLVALWGSNVFGAEVSPSPMFKSIHKVALQNLSGGAVDSFGKGGGDILDFTYHPWVCVTLEPYHCTVDPFYCYTADPNFDCTNDPLYCMTYDPADPNCQPTSQPVICITQDPQGCTQDPYYCFTYSPEYPECDTPNFTVDPYICTTLDPNGTPYCTENPQYCFTVYPIDPDCIPTGTKEERKSDIPKEINLSSSPNPFTDYTIISYSLPKGAHVLLSLYDITGRLVKKLVDSNLSTGSYTLYFSGKGLPRGLYIITLTAGNQTFSTKITLER